MSPPTAPKIGIVLLNWNGTQDTLACLHSLAAASYSHLDTIVIDNGSTDDSVLEISRQFPDLLLIPNGRNLGFAEGSNVGIRAALERGADFVLLLNNDTVVAPRMFEAFLETFRACPQVGILGAKIFLHDTPDTLDHLGGIWNAKLGKFDFVGARQKHLEAEWEVPREIDYVCGAALMVRKEVFGVVGLLDPRYFLIWEESDFCFRARRAGFQTMTCPQAVVWHKVSASFTGGKTHSTYFWWRNRFLFIEKNCAWRERVWLYFRKLVPEIIHMLKVYYLKRLMFWCFFFLFLQKQKRKNTKNSYKPAPPSAACAIICCAALEQAPSGSIENYRDCWP